MNASFTAHSSRDGANAHGEQIWGPVTTTLRGTGPGAARAAQLFQDIGMKGIKMKLRTIAAVTAAMLGLSLLSTSAYARDGRWDGNRNDGYSQSYGYGQNYGHRSHRRGDDCNDRRHYSQYRHHDRFAGRYDGGRYGGRHDGWRGHDRHRGDNDGHRRHGRDRNNNGWRNH